MLGFGLMRRRELIDAFGGLAAAWPFAARAQQSAKLPIIGFLGSAIASIGNPWLSAFVQRMRGLNWIEGRSVAIEVRWAGGRSERVAEIASEFVRQKVDIIVTTGGEVAEAKQKTETESLGRYCYSTGDRAGRAKQRSDPCGKLA
jgi:putative tryptophan/tyrosine transport system substrate-binding protein